MYSQLLQHWEYIKELANRIEAAHTEGILKAVEDLMHGKR